MNRLHIRHGRLWVIDDRQLRVNSYRVEAILTTGLQEPSLEGWREFATVQIV